MNILAIDTSSEYLSLAIAKNTEVYHQQFKALNKQSEFILPEIDKLLQTANMDLSEINLTAYNQGPGSFTGLRIGLSCALGIAYSIGCRLQPIPAFALYANPVIFSEEKDLSPLYHAFQHADGSVKKDSIDYHTQPNAAPVNYKHTIVTLDARLEQIYIAGINRADFRYTIQPQLINPENLDKIMAEYSTLTPANTVFTGTGFKIYKDKIKAKISDVYTYIEQEYLSAVNMLDIAIKNIYPQVSVFDADLLYLRNKVALDINEQQQNKKTKQSL